MASQRSLTAGYIFPDAPRNYSTDTNFVLGLTTNALVVGNVLQQISQLDDKTAECLVELQPESQVLTRFNYTLGGVAYSLELGISGTIADINRVINELQAALLSRSTDNALPRVLQFSEDCLQITIVSGRIVVTLNWKEVTAASPFFIPVSIEVTGATPYEFS